MTTSSTEQHHRLLERLTAWAKTDPASFSVVAIWCLLTANWLNQYLLGGLTFDSPRAQGIVFIVWFALPLLGAAVLIASGKRNKIKKGLLTLASFFLFLPLTFLVLLQAVDKISTNQDDTLSLLNKHQIIGPIEMCDYRSSFDATTDFALVERLELRLIPGISWVRHWYSGRF